MMKSFKVTSIALLMGFMANAALADEPLKQEGKKNTLSTCVKYAKLPIGG